MNTHVDFGCGVSGHFRSTRIGNLRPGMPALSCVVGLILQMYTLEMDVRGREEWMS